MKPVAPSKTKPSNIPWLGQVPEHWEVKRLGDHMRVVNGFPFDAKLFGHDDGWPLIRVRDVLAGRTETYWQGEVVPEAQIEDGDLLVGMDGDFHVGIWAGGQAMLNQRVCCLRTFPTLDKRYLRYLLPYPIKVVNDLTYATTVKHLSSFDVAKIRFPLPPLPEQRAIATYLDARTARIDGLVARQRRLVQLLKEKRQALITRAVTRGLNPNAKMKDSGVPWLGEVPVGWEVEKFFRIVSITEGQVNPDVEPYVDMLLIAPNHIESRTGKLIARETSAEQAAESGKYLCPDGAVVYSKIRPALRKATAAPEPCLCSADMYPMMGINGLTNGYLLWLLLCDSFSQWVVLDSDRVAMPKVNRDTLNAYWLPLPPVDEQEAIVKFIAEQTSRIDTLVTKVEQAVERLQEYRTTLISAAVTGKVRVAAG